MHAIRGLLKNLVRQDKGLEVVEYAIITGLIVAACVTAIAAIGNWVKAQYEALKTDVGA
jgi:Flp pilus assembly pilin Flp